MFYWWKRVVPPVLFGSKHAILFQASLIPLTMSRFSIAALSETFLDRFIPLNRAVRIHMQLGYAMVLIIVLAALLFVAYFGALCGQGEQVYCDGLKSEIMITGYAMTALTLLVASTSMLRNRIPYEAFYYIHMLVFILYALIVLHTIDGVQRVQKRRHQTFAWVTLTLLYYFCDRAVLHINHRYKCRLISSSTVAGRGGPSTVVLKLRRPVLFDFKPGQYALVRVPEIDPHHHPFSIASGPSSSCLEFYIEVFGEGSWTKKLFDMLRDHAAKNKNEKPVDIEVMGPYGSSLGKTEDYSHAFVIGSGTGKYTPPYSTLYRNVDSHNTGVCSQLVSRRYCPIAELVQEAC